jgi:hypothetical protein
MKMFGLILIAGITLLLTAYAAEHLQITAKKQSFPEKQLSVERTYRGNQCISLEMTEGGKRTRAFRVNGKTVMAESDEDGDGFFESFMVFDPETEDFEWFTRTTNNIVRPVASEKLQEAKSKKKAADKALSDLIEK